MVQAPADRSRHFSQMIKFEQNGNESFLNCALVYCIDLEQYRAWLTSDAASNDAKRKKRP
jgi:hypothetical protein